jgi:GTPase SAR1 family protein
VQINFARREIGCKIVYYGPGMSGKTTNLEVVHEKTPRENKGELTCIATEGDRTLFFDFMPLSLGNIMGMNTKFQLYTVPGQVYYNSTRKLVLRGVDGVIFVADSAKEKLDENIESLRNLEQNLRDYGRDIKDMPIILQYNKRDRADALDVETLNEKLNPDGRPFFEAVAPEGKGVFDCLKALAGLVIQNLNQECARRRPATKPEETVSAGVKEDPGSVTEGGGGGAAVAAATRQAVSTRTAPARPAPVPARRSAPATAPRPAASSSKPTTWPASAPATRPIPRTATRATGHLRRRSRVSAPTLVFALVAILGLVVAAMWFMNLMG